MRTIITNYVVAFVCVLSTFLLSVAFGFLWAKMKPRAVEKWALWLQLIGGALVLWAVWGLLGFEIQTFGGVSTPEVVNKWLFRILNGIGMFLVFISSSAMIFNKDGG